MTICKVAGITQGNDRTRYYKTLHFASRHAAIRRAATSSPVGNISPLSVPITGGDAGNMGVPPEGGMGAVRFSLGRTMTREEVEEILARLMRSAR